MNSISQEEELNQVNVILNNMVKDLALLGILVINTKVPKDTNDKEVIYTISVPEKYDDKSGIDIALEGKSIIINSLKRCNISENNIVVKYAIRENHIWDKAKIDKMKEIVKES